MKDTAKKAIDSVVKGGNYNRQIGNVMSKYKNHELEHVTLVVGGEYVFYFKNEEELMNALKDYKLEETGV